MFWLILSDITMLTFNRLLILVVGTSDTNSANLYDMLNVTSVFVVELRNQHLPMNSALLEVGSSVYGHSSN